MINFLKTKAAIIRIFTLMALILPVLIPVKSWVLAENKVRYFSSENVTYTSDFGIENPEGMAYFSGADSFVLWGVNQSERMIVLRKESSKKTNFAQYITNPLGAAFDKESNSLLSLDAGNTELHKIKVDGKNNLPLLNESTSFKMGSLDLNNVQGMTVDPASGQLFILDAGKQQLFVMSPDPANESNYGTAANNGIRFISLAGLSDSSLRGVAYNPTNGHLYLGDPGARKVYEVTKAGEWVSTYDISSLNFENPSAMLFAPSQDATDDPNIMALYILDSGQPSQSGSTLASDQRNNSEKGQIVELSLQAPAALPSGTTLLPASLVRTFDTSNQSWTLPGPSSPDPAGIDYWPAANRLVISDSEVDEMRPYWQGSNVFLSTTSGNLTGTCSTTDFTGEPTGVAINPNNNHIFIVSDYQDRLFEISLGPDGQYCTSDDTVTNTSLVTAYGVTDAEDAAYGNNTIFIAGGDDAEVFVIPLGANGVVGGGDDGPMTHWDTNSLGFADTEGIGFNHDAGTLFVVSTKRTDKYLGEFSTSGTLLRAYNLSFMPDEGNIRSDVTYAPGSQNPLVKSIYIASRGIDNDSNRTENDGKVWEIAISNDIVPTPTNVIVPTPTNVIVPTPTSGGAGSANVQVNIGGNTVGSYNIPPGGNINPSFSANNGPVKITSTNNVPILPSMQAFWREPGYRSSYSELMGLPKEQLSTEYWFPWYNNLYPYIMDQGFRIANINATGPNTIEIWVGDTMLDRFDLGIDASTRVGYPVDNGPIRITCTTCTGNEKILAAMRVIWQEPGPRTSYSELMGLPKEQLSTEYWFPWYNNAAPASLDQGFRIANVDSSTHTIQVRVGTTLLESFPLGAGASVRTSYPIDNGPIRIVCTDCAGSGKILAAMRVIWQEPGLRFSYSELMGLPKEQLSKEYWFPWYNNAAPASMDQGFRIANVDTSGHMIQIWAGTTLLDSFPLAPGASARTAYAVESGPIRVICTTCTSSGKILAAMRVIWQEPGFRSSYSEMMGMPVEALSTEYWFPWYNNLDTVSMNQAFRISVP